MAPKLAGKDRMTKDPMKRADVRNVHNSVHDKVVEVGGGHSRIPPPTPSTPVVLLAVPPHGMKWKKFTAMMAVMAPVSAGGSGAA